MEVIFKRGTNRRLTSGIRISESFASPDAPENVMMVVSFDKLVREIVDEDKACALNEIMKYLKNAEMKIAVNIGDGHLHIVRREESVIPMKVTCSVREKWPEED